MGNEPPKIEKPVKEQIREQKRSIEKTEIKNPIKTVILLNLLTITITLLPPQQPINTIKTAPKTLKNIKHHNK